MKFRQGRTSDLPRILSDWVRSYESSPVSRRLDKDLYFSGQRALIDAILPASRVVVATPDADDDQIIGWACGTDAVLHYVHVAREYRGRGVGRALHRQLGSPVAASHLGRRGPVMGTTFDPYWWVR